MTAVRYDVVDCRDLYAVQAVFNDAPENALELHFPKQRKRIVLVPRCDKQHDLWHTALLEVHRVFGQAQKNTPSFQTPRHFTVEELNHQIRQVAIHATLLQEWDGKRWCPKVTHYF